MEAEGSSVWPIDGWRVDVKRGLTSDDESIAVGDMKYAHATPDVYECADLMPRDRD